MPERVAMLSKLMVLGYSASPDIGNSSGLS